MSAIVNQEKEALAKSSKLHEVLDEQRRDLEHMLANIPKHLPIPEKVRPKPAEAHSQGHADTREEVENQEYDDYKIVPAAVPVRPVVALGQSNAQNAPGGIAKESHLPESAAKGASSTALKKASNKLTMSIAPVTVAEFEALPKYQGEACSSLLQLRSSQGANRSKHWLQWVVLVVTVSMILSQIFRNSWPINTLSCVSLHRR